MYPEISCFFEFRSRLNTIVVSFPFLTASSRCAKACEYEDNAEGTSGTASGKTNADN